jgi:VanZ family protein
VKVIETVEKVTPDNDLSLDNLNHLVRKNAHFIIYLVLAILVQSALRRFRIVGFKSILFALGICVLYAITDEIHQIFVSGRGAQVKDVFIDSTGAIVGIVFYAIVKRSLKDRGKGLLGRH